MSETVFMSSARELVEVGASWIYRGLNFCENSAVFVSIFFNFPQNLANKI